nr:carboxylating nicotinate-nucleotide diphosphorylase [Kofleriaceae bacterium]
MRRLIELALDEDLGRGDVTSRSVFGAAGAAGAAGADGPAVVADMNARQPIVAFGLDVAAAVFQLVDESIELERHCADGARLDKGSLLITVRGPAHSVLAAERTALNFVQRLSGVATLAKRYAELVAGTPARVVDTRKTTPGFRALEKAAVLAGGCANHRFDLGSGILIKDNHIAACGSVGEAVRRAKAAAGHLMKVEIEVDTPDQLNEALPFRPDVIMLDNFALADLEAAVARVAGAVTLEASGGVTLQTVRAIAETGVDA